MLQWSQRDSCLTKFSLTQTFYRKVKVFYGRKFISISHILKGIHPFILRPRFLQFLEIWFEKSGSRKVVLQTRIFFLVREKWLTRKKGGFIPFLDLFSGWRKVVLQTPIFFLVREKWLTRKKNPNLQNHFSRTTFLHFSRKVVAD